MLSLDLLHLLPELVMKILILVLLLFLCVDVLHLYALTGASRNPKQWEETDAQIDKLSARLSSWISERVERRVKKAYPSVRKTEEKAAEKGMHLRSDVDFIRLYYFYIGAF